jgi:hypothetical protein
MSHDLQQMTDKVAAFIKGGDQTDESKFNKLALEIFELQYTLIAPYRAFCRRRAITPDRVQNWRSIPAVPADAFKHFNLFIGKPEAAIKVFKSSGTTDTRRASRSYFSEIGLELMNSAIEVNAIRNLFPQGRHTRLLIIAPNPDIAPHMIMVHGMNHMINRFGIEGSHFLIDGDGFNTDKIIAELQECQKQHIPVTLMGGSFGFVHLFDAMEVKGLRCTLPEGSRMMDAGGYKGRSREVDRTQFVDWACSMLGLAPDRVTNLLGMTELASQIYDFIASDSPKDRSKQPPHWMRTLLIDPRRTAAGEPFNVTEPGEQGLLLHFDLANVERPMAVQAEDIGVLCTVSQEPHRMGFEILGRAKGAEPRGCSLTLDEFAKSQVARQA